MQVVSEDAAQAGSPWAFLFLGMLVLQRCASNRPLPSCAQGTTLAVDIAEVALSAHVADPWGEEGDGSDGEGGDSGSLTSEGAETWDGGGPSCGEGSDDEVRDPAWSSGCGEVWWNLLQTLPCVSGGGLAESARCSASGRSSRW